MSEKKYTERLVSSKKHDRMVVRAIELKAENDTLRDALKEVMSWIDNWEPEFANDSDWPKTRKNAQEALKETE